MALEGREGEATKKQERETERAAKLEGRELAESKRATRLGL
jgi:hypothetical protein